MAIGRVGLAVPCEFNPNLMRLSLKISVCIFPPQNYSYYCSGNRKDEK